MNKLTTLLSIFAIITAIGFAITSGSPSHPTSDRDIAKTAAMITNMKGNSGGTGVVLHSSFFSSQILTNRHVCQVVKFGGLVTTDGHKATVSSFVTSETHDLCLITVNEDLGVNTEVAKESPELYSPSIVSGHPALLPTLITHGIFSHKEIIEIMTEVRKCTEDEFKGQYGLVCLLLGGMPVIKTYVAQVSSSLIMPGSSGSAVWNSSGRIAALVFAGAGNLGYSHLVPVEFINNFLQNEVPKLETKFPLDDSLSKLQTEPEQKLRNACKDTNNVIQYMIIKNYCKYVDLDFVYYNENN